MVMNSNFNFEKPDGDSQAATAIASTSPVMLALFTFRHTDMAVDVALEKAMQRKRLVIVYGHNINPGLYFIETGIGLYPNLKEQCEKELLTEFEQQWKEKVETIANRARAEGLQVVTYVRAERFASLCSEVIKKEKPFLVVTTRTRGPAWVRGLFGSSKDHLLSHAECPVIEA